MTDSDAKTQYKDIGALLDWIKAQPDLDAVINRLRRPGKDARAFGYQSHPPCCLPRVACCDADCRPANLAQFELRLWDLKALRVALEVLKKRFGDKAYLVVKRDRDLKAARNESQTISTGSEAGEAPLTGLALFLYRANATPDGEVAVWWPQLRFPVGNYVLAFSFDW